MNKMNQIPDWIRARYRLDGLSYALLILYTILIVINLFLKIQIINLVSIPIILYIFFRSFSKNTARRNAENQVFLKYFNLLKSAFRLQNKKLRDIKTHRYIKCPKCQKMLRVKKVSGIHSVDCPQCHQELRIKI